MKLATTKKQWEKHMNEEDKKLDMVFKSGEIEKIKKQLFSEHFCLIFGSSIFLIGCILIDYFLNK